MKHLLKLLICLCPLSAAAAMLNVDMYAATDSGNGQGAKLGSVKIEDSAFGGILLTPQLQHMPAGVHGFHIHQTANCAPSMKEGHEVAAGAAGGHLDPANTGKHAGPYGNGHLGDLPVLIVDADGSTTHPTLAPRLKVADLAGHSLMVHAGGDNYADLPNPLGGGAARMACGVIESK